MLKWDGSTWLGLALVELLEGRALMGPMDLRHGNAQEAKGERVCFFFYI